MLDVTVENKTQTDNFTVKGKWTIHAEIGGQISAGCGIQINKGDGSYVDAFTFSENGGDSQQRQGGTFFLEITPFGGSCHIVATDVPE